MRPYVPVAVVGFTGLLVSVGLFMAARQIEQQRSLEQFGRLAEDRAHTVRRQVESQLHALQALRGFFDASEDVTFPEFEKFVKTILTWAGGVQAFEWVPRVPHTERGLFEKAARSDGFAGFAITERDGSGDLVPASERAEYLPVFYACPKRGNEAALGFDVASNPARREALEAAMQSTHARATRPITLVQETSGQRSVLIFLPVYRGGIPGPTRDERDRNLKGFVLGVFRVGDLLHAALARLDPAGVDVGLYDDSTSPAPERLAHLCVNPPLANESNSMASSVATPEQQARYRSDLAFEVAGRRWRVSSVPTAAFFGPRPHWTSWGVLASGLLLSLILTRYLTTLAGRKSAEQALSQTEERNRLILSNALDAVVTIDGDGTITAWEGVSEEVFGWTRDEAMGQTLTHLIVPDRLRKAHERSLRESGERAQGLMLDRRVQLTALHRDGHEFPIELAITALGDGDSAEFNAFIRDISDRVDAERSLRQAAERFKILVDNAPEAMTVLDADTMHFDDVNENAVRLFKMSREELLQIGPADVSPATQPDGRESAPYAREMIERAMGGEIPVFEWCHTDRDGNKILCEVRLVRLPSEHRRLLRGSITDISERKLAERRQQMLMRELDHRVKNNLSAVLAITEQSISTSRSLHEFQVSFSGRIRSLARLHEALAKANWEGAEIEEIARLTLGAYMIPDNPRITLSGETLLLPARASSPICMALHELTTNATKYGALSTADGCVTLTWRTRNEGSLILTWQESGGPSVSRPSQEGFGTMLIKDVIEYELRGVVRLEFLAEGFRCTMEIPQGALAERSHV